MKYSKPRSYCVFVPDSSKRILAPASDSLRDRTEPDHDSDRRINRLEMQFNQVETKYNKLRRKLKIQMIEKSEGDI